MRRYRFTYRGRTGYITENRGGGCLTGLVVFGVVWFLLVKATDAGYGTKAWLPVGIGVFGVVLIVGLIIRLIRR